MGRGCPPAPYYLGGYLLLRENGLWVEVEATAEEQRQLRKALTFRTKDEEVCLLVERGSTLAFLRGLWEPLVRRNPTLSIPPPPPLAVEARDETWGLDGVTPRWFQPEAVAACLQRRRGIVQLPTGTGKTEIMLALFRCLGVRCLVVVATIGQMKQMAQRALDRGFPEVGMWGGGKRVKLATAPVVVAIAASLVKGVAEGNAAELMDIECMVFDEVHHLGTAETWYAIADGMPWIKYRFGFSATPLRNAADPWSNPWDVVMQGYTGEIIYTRSREELAEFCPDAQCYFLKPPLLYRAIRYANGEINTEWNRLYRDCVVTADDRNMYLSLLVQSISAWGGRVLVLVQQVRHARELLRRFLGTPVTAWLIMGGEKLLALSPRSDVEIAGGARRAAQALADGDCKCLIGTTAVHEAIDIPGATDIVIAGAGKAPLSVPQRIGRGMRGEKLQLRIWDIWDTSHPVLTYQSKQRKAIYEQYGVPVSFPPLMPPALATIAAAQRWVQSVGLGLME